MNDFPKISDEQVDEDLNFSRAMVVLDREGLTPDYLITMWRVLGNHKGGCPYPEKYRPFWFNGLEKYILS